MPAVSFRREKGKMDVPDRLLDMLDTEFTDIRRRQSGAATITVVTGSSGGGSSGGSAGASTEYRAGRATVSSGAVVVSFSSALPSTDYELFAWMYRADRESWQFINMATATKSTSGFATTVNGDGTLIYLAIMRA